ncbi:hypothetical protein CROQUDRAFT_665841 [Cronartium quercuum f. sp. fusiforme G11]|uniref:DNA polymerase alpha subunit B n=1 Tax=Cronartium quercuum f. sp. fusiforme G11 TaxID=708437 RepID=A0A9P6T5V0_9BASI|nr:hypothetical protein CROQUDRAFT_665841 [Cronartium quercuum f. sp. fusiforme G11]
MNGSNEQNGAGPSSVPIKKIVNPTFGTGFEEFGILSTPKSSRRTGNISSGSLSKPSSTSRPSAFKAKREEIEGDLFSSPFASRAKALPSEAINTTTPSKLNLSTHSKFQSPNPPNSPTSFESRPEPFKVIDSLNSHLPLPSGPVSSQRNPKHPIKFSATSGNSKWNYRYMFEKLSDRSDVLDQKIEHGANILANWYEIEEWSDPTIVSQEDIWAVGRICAETQDAKITDKACWLETSRLGGYGKRVWLQFEDTMKVRGVGMSEGGVGLFPGAIVGVKGRNGGGTYFSVQEILTMPPIDPPMSYAQELLEFLPSVEDAPISFSVACGPFTTDDNLEFWPLDALLVQFVKEKPDLVILLGPFIDINHPLIKTGDIDIMPSTIFREQIASRLHKLRKNSPETRIFLVPSLRDILAPHSAYPQSPLSFRDPELGLAGQIRCLPNPITITINELVIGINNVDVLMSIRKEEFFKLALVENEGETNEGPDPNAKDLISRACRHVMRQRSFYPIFPPTMGGGLDTVNLDVTHHELLKYDPVGADILIMPTTFTAFAKIVDSTVIANPRQLCKGKGTGTYARFTIHAFERKSLEAQLAQKDVPLEDIDPLEHNVWERCRVDLVRI